ncbi:hypothetical protein FS749_002228 [Ceratobasidium sp. UAMH 11750]|nr:hypothetical protein FS749_002228 [Ceratobasidium sp. UAMH 11750]
MGVAPLFERCLGRPLPSMLPTLKSLLLDLAVSSGRRRLAHTLRLDMRLMNMPSIPLRLPNFVSRSRNTVPTQTWRNPLPRLRPLLPLPSSETPTENLT